MVDASAFRPRGGRKEARSRRSRRRNPDGTMTLVEHLFELRYRLGWAILGIFLGAIVGFIWFSSTISPIPTLGDLLTRPYCALPAATRIQLSGNHCALLQTQPFEAFMIRMKVGAVVGMVLTSPMWLYQVWAFVTPALYRKEKRFGVIFVVLAALLFLAGALLAYFLLPETLKILTGVGGTDFVTAMAGSVYVSFMINLLIIFGASFELPLLIVMLNIVGVLKYQKLKTWRRGIIFGLFVFAAFVTPGGDPVSMIMLSTVLTLLFELAIQITRLNDKRKSRLRMQADLELDDDTASQVEPAQPLDYKDVT
jgi:sec-independent protein translocase protein TatC